MAELVKDLLICHYDPTYSQSIEHDLQNKLLHLANLSDDNIKRILDKFSIR